MSLPYILKIDWAKWFEKACPKCKKLVLEFLAKECGDEIKESLLRGITPTIRIPGLNPIWDSLCERDQELLKKYSELDFPNTVKEQLLRGTSSPRPRRKNRRERG